MRWSGHALVMLSALRPASSAAAPADDAAVEFAKGQQAFSELHYLEAGAHFEAAYAVDPNPAYLFNAAQAYRLGRACSRAKSYFERFLALNPDLELQPKITRFVRDAEQCVIDQARLEQRARLSASDAGRTKRIAGIGIGAAGVVLAATATYFAVQAQSKSDELDRCTEMSGCTAVGLLDQEGKRAQLWSRLLFAGGGAALIGGAVTFYLGVREGSAEPQRLSLVPISGGGMVVYRGPL